MIALWEKQVYKCTRLQHFDIYEMGFFEKPVAKHHAVTGLCLKERKNNQDY